MSADRTSASGDGGGLDRLATLFEELRLLGRAEREARLAALAAEDAALHAELRVLLSHHEDDSGVLATPELPVDPELLASLAEDDDADEGAAPRVPARVGPYRILGLLGRGGMGAVYLAEREGADFSQQVAVKLLRADVFDRELLLRFRAERRILASLRHPDIAAMLDGGTTEDGRPYVVMERVEGTGLVTHCERRGSSVHARIELFCRVCAAVEHAHRSLIVHRDLKPANVLVTAEGQPKLLDFGIAKLLRSENADHSVAVTSAGMMLFTPEYASPEQVRGEAITTATDVYALGAILYELLSGERAHRLETRTPSEVERVVCEQERTAPSSVAADAGRSRALAGDLDNIVLRALRAEPERRYGSATELADDLKRYLRGLPVMARPDTWRYRTRKFVRRHRLGVAAAAAFVLLAVAAAIALLAQAKRIAAERDVARNESAVAGEVSEFMVGLFQTAEADQVRADQISARDLLTSGIHRIVGEVSSGPLVRAGLLLAMGRAASSLGSYDDAEPLLVEANQLRERAGTPAGRADSAKWLGLLRLNQGRTREAEALVRRAIALRRSVDPDPSETAELQRVLASVLRQGGHPQEAFDVASESEHMLVPGDEVGLTHVLVEEGLAQLDLGNAEEALRLVQRSSDLALRRYGPGHASHARSLRLLGNIYDELGRSDDAVAAMQQALDIIRQTYDDGHPDVEVIRFGLAQVLRNAGQLERAEKLFHGMVERDRVSYPDHPNLALDLAELGVTLLQEGRFDEARELLEEALAMQQRTLPRDHPEIATTQSHLAALYHATGDLERAEEYGRAALELRQRVFPPDHPMTLASRQLMAVVMHERGELDAAEEQYREILAVHREKLGEHPMVAGSLYSLAVLLRARHSNGEALRLVEESAAMFRRTLPAGHPELALPLVLEGRLLLEAGDAERAEPLLREGYAIRTAALPDPHPETALAARLLGECLITQQRFSEAEPLLLGAHEDFTASLGRDHGGAVRCRAALVRLYEAWGRPADAERWRD